MKGDGAMKDTGSPSKKDESGFTKGTFEVSVKFKQNADWQGQILWAEKNLRQSFRSVLEMLKLMDEALAEGGAKSVGWEEEKQ